jgi:Uma2 family endonuclease
MAEQVISTPSERGSIPSEAGAQTIVSADEYMAKYAHDFYEWVSGEVIKMAPVSDRHDVTGRYFSILLEAYFALSPIGVIREAPFVLRLDAVNSRREPDLQIILNSNTGQLTKTAMIGPADICIEIVSLESVERDYGKKFEEYEAAGVKEYWITDPIRREARFCRLTAEGRYQTQLPDSEGNYQTPLLPGLRLQVPSLWQEPLPDIISVVDAVKAMLAK